MRSRASWGGGGAGWTGTATPKRTQSGSRTALLAGSTRDSPRERGDFPFWVAGKKVNIMCFPSLHHAPSSNHRGEGKLTWLIFCL